MAELFPKLRRAIALSMLGPEIDEPTESVDLKAEREELRHLVLTLWDKAGTTAYDKKQWVRLSSLTDSLGKSAMIVQSRPNDGMKASAAIIIGAVAIAGAIAWSASENRYELAQASNGAIARLDRRTGKIDLCLMQRDEATRTFVAPCTGEK